MYKISWWLCFTSIFIVFACKTKIHPGKPDVDYLTDQFETEVSNINIPVTVSLDFLESEINNAFTGIIYQEDTYNKDVEDKYKIKVRKNGKVELQGKGDKLYYDVPLRTELSFKKNILGFNVEKDLDLDLVIKFETGLELNKDWTYTTDTKNVGYELESDPVITIGFIEIPVSTVIELILGYSMDDISAIMDEEFSKAFELKTMMEDIWTQIQEPILLEEKYDAWLVVEPHRVSVTPLDADRKYLRMTMGVEANMQVSVGNRPNVLVNRAHPDLSFEEELSKKFNMSIPSHITYIELSKILNENLDGYSYEHNNKKITLNKIETFGNGAKLVVKVGFSGDAEGELYLMGVPKYDNEKHSIYIDDFDYDVKSKKAVLKLASWIFKGSFKKQVQEQMVYSFKDHIDEINQHIVDGFEQQDFGKYFDFHFKIEQVNVHQVTVGQDGLYMNGAVDGQSSLYYGLTDEDN